MEDRPDKGRIAIERSSYATEWAWIDGETKELFALRVLLRIVDTERDTSVVSVRVEHSFSSVL